MDKKIDLQELASNITSKGFAEKYNVAIENICMEFGRQLLELAYENSEIERDKWGTFIDKESITDTINQVK